MIRHVVLIRFKKDLPEGEIEAAFAMLDGLRALLPGILQIAHGPNLSAEGLARGFTHGFTVDFADQETLAQYLALPEHATVGARLVGAAEGGLDGLLVLDFPLRA